MILKKLEGLLKEHFSIDSLGNNTSCCFGEYNKKECRSFYYGLMCNICRELARVKGKTK